jgi:hypothetical protein
MFIVKPLSGDLMISAGETWLHSPTINNVPISTVGLS